MTKQQELNKVLRAVRDDLALAVIRYLLEADAWGVSRRLKLPLERARENVALRVIEHVKEQGYL